MRTTPTLRQRLKQDSRRHIEDVAVQLLSTKGYQGTSVDEIVTLAGTTRTTFYRYFKAKSDLVSVIQERELGPAIIALCERLDSHDPISRKDLRDWVDEYGREWQRLRVFLDAYADASRADSAVGSTILPNTYAVTGRMVRFLGRFSGAAREAAHDKLMLFIFNLDQLMYMASLMNDRKASERMFVSFTDVFWRGLFNTEPQPKRTGAPRKPRG
jgi:AcrR family transcriptional regulator